jgi:hypothetical protein
MLPTFLVIGAMKAGTTSLYYYLDEHPEIGMSVRKETDFFLDAHGNWDRGRDWYASLVPEAPMRGECSPNYTKQHLFEGVPERIASVCPDVKLIYLVRDPIERTVSHYVGSRMAGREDRPFPEAVANAEASNYVLTSCYHRQLEPYRALFREDRILVVQTEALKSEPAATLQTIYRFLGVDDTFRNERTDRRFNVAAAKTKPQAWVRWLSRQVPQRWKDRLRPYMSLRWLPGERVERPEVTPSVQAHLEAVFRPDVEALRAWTGRAFADWSV